MNAGTRMLLFTLFAPITVPIYLLFLAVSNLLGGAFYIVVEASVAKLLGRPMSLTRGQMALLAAPVLIAAPFAAAVHLTIAFVRGLARLLCWFGWWQTGVKPRTVSFVFGLVFSLTALWSTITCMNAAVGLAAIGRGVSQSNEDLFVEFIERPRTLGEMPEEMQVRRKALLGEIRRRGEAYSPKWAGLAEVLEDDDSFFRAFLRNGYPEIARRLAGIPWYFVPAALSPDGLDHSKLLFGPLLFVVMLLVRWPGTFEALRWRNLAVVWFLARVGLVVGAVYYVATWTPGTAHVGFRFADGEPARVFKLLCPASWLRFDAAESVEPLWDVWLILNPSTWARPEWYLFNAGLWLILIGLLIFVWWLAWRISPFLGWPRYYVAFLASRLLQRKRIAFFSVGAVTLCVAMMIIVSSVMGGFVDSIRERAHGLLGDLVVDGDLQGFPYYEEFISHIRQLRDEKTGEPIVVEATPLIHSYGILQFFDTKRTKAVRIWGVRLEEYVRVNEFGNDLFYHNRYGWTRLDEPVALPVFGFDENGIARLPEEMERQYAAFLAAQPPEKRAELEKRFARGHRDYFPGPGIYAPSDSTDFRPGFEGEKRHGIIIGRDVFLRRMPSGEYERDPNYPRGAPVYLTVLPLTRGGEVSNESPPKPGFRYIDDSRTGIHEIDSMNVYVGFDRLQELMSMGPLTREDGTLAGARCSQIQIKLRAEFGKPKEALQRSKRLMKQAWERLTEQILAEKADPFEAQMLGNVGISTWEEMQQKYIQAIEKEEVLVMIMFGVVSLVAVFLILCIFYMIVQEKTRDVGIIKSVGGSTEGVAAVFLVYGGAIGLVGAILGSLLGTTFVDHINEIQDWLARINPEWRVWSPETYSFDKIPSVWKTWDVIWICILSILASILGAAFPAIRAGRTWPVESLRYE